MCVCDVCVVWCGVKCVVCEDKPSRCLLSEVKEICGISQIINRINPIPPVNLNSATVSQFEVETNKTKWFNLNTKKRRKKHTFKEERNTHLIGPNKK